jgi:putative ABC transport system permease protein
MNPSVQIITWQGLAWSFAPVVVAVAILAYWRASAGTAVYAVVRMLIQLLAVGLILTYIFEAEHAGVITLVLLIMITAASWITIRPIRKKSGRNYRDALISITVGGGLTLVLVTQLVIGLEPWFHARYMIPLAGMIFANAMNAVSLSAERFEAEIGSGKGYVEARDTAMHASLIPNLNSLFAVGLVALPGMMTGQILSGVSPVVAAKYQIVVMCMIFGSSCIAAAIYLRLAKAAD